MKKMKIILLCVTVFWGQNMLASQPNIAGKRLKVTGRWNGKFLEVDRFKERNSDQDPLTGRVEGQVDTVIFAKSAFVIGPMIVKMSKATKFIDISPAKLAKGVSVEAIGRLEQPGLLIAESIEPGGASAPFIEMLGAVTANRVNGSGAVQAKILGVPVWIPQDVFDRGMSLIRHPDDKRPDQQLTLELFGRPLVIGGEVGSNVNFRGDYRLERAAEDDEARLDNGLELELFFRPSQQWAAFAELKSSREQIVYDQAREGGLETRIRRGEMWLFASKLFGTPLALHLGRQNFHEDREWWWDSDLDALRVYYTGRRIYAEFAVAEEQTGLHFDSDAFDPEDAGIRRYLGRVALALRRGHRLSFFYLQQRDRSGWQLSLEENFEPDDPEDADLRWRGLRLAGDLDFGFAGDVSYWIDTASLDGRESYFDEDVFQTALETDDGRRNRGRGSDDDREQRLLEAQKGVLHRSVSGWAFDAGFSIETKLPLEPTLSLSYAAGSGDGGNDPSHNGTFRQTGLHDNNAKYSGVDRFRYYGELYRPDLSNIRIFSASIGVPIWRSSSLELLFHRYRQYALSTSRNSRLRTRPDGLSPELGDELNLVIGLEKWQHLEIEIIAGLFRAGKAYGALAGELAYNTIVKFDYNF